MRLCARGPSGTLTASTPARLERPTCREHASRIDAARRHDLDRRDELARARACRPSCERSASGTGSTPVVFRTERRLVLASCALRRRVPCRGESGRMPSTIAVMCSGVVPQQPPTIFAPACTRCRAYVAMYSGLAMYMLRPPTSRGMPAFGCAVSFFARDLRHLLDRLENRLRADRAVEADDVGAERVERPRDVFGGAVGRAAVDADRHLRDDRHRRIDVARGDDAPARSPAGRRTSRGRRGRRRLRSAPAICSRKKSRAPRRATSGRTARCECQADRWRRRRGRSSPAAARAIAPRARLISRTCASSPYCVSFSAVRAEGVRLEDLRARLHVLRGAPRARGPGARRLSSS